MADVKDINNKKKKLSKEEKLDKDNWIVSIIMLVLILACVLLLLAFLIKQDIGGLGSEILKPVIGDVPVINKILPEEKKEKKETEEETDTDVAASERYTTLKEALVAIEELEKENDKLKAENDDINTEVSELAKENTRLKEFELQQEEFEALKKQFDEEIVYGDDALDISEFEEYYNNMNPDTAAEIYEKVVKELQGGDEVESLAKTYAKMDPGAAATALEAMSDDIDIVCDILKTMAQKERAAIMDEMSPSFVARVTKIIYED